MHFLIVMIIMIVLIVLTMQKMNNDNSYYCHSYSCISTNNDKNYTLNPQIGLGRSPQLPQSRLWPVRGSAPCGNRAWEECCLGVWSLGFGVWGQGLGFGVQDLGFRVQGQDLGSGFRVWDFFFKAVGPFSPPSPTLCRACSDLQKTPTSRTLLTSGQAQVTREKTVQNIIPQASQAHLLQDHPGQEVVHEEGLGFRVQVQGLGFGLGLRVQGLGGVLVVQGV